MDQLIGLNCTLQTESTKTLLSDGLVKYVLYHNDKIIRNRTNHLSYLPEYFIKMEDPYPSDKFYTFEEKMIKPIHTNKTKSVENKNRKNKFISIGVGVKKWLSLFCSRITYEADLVFNDLLKELQSNTVNTNNLDTVMFRTEFNINMFRLVAKIVANHDYLLKTRMQITILEKDLISKITERYEAHHPMRNGNLQIAGWIAHLIDDFFKVLACYISSKNWYDRGATLNENDFAWILWQLSENTEYERELSNFIDEIRLNLYEEKIDDTNHIEFDLNVLSDGIKNLMTNPTEPKNKGKNNRGKKPEPNKTITNLAEIQPSVVFPIQIQPQPQNAQLQPMSNIQPQSQSTQLQPMLNAQLMQMQPMLNAQPQMQSQNAQMQLQPMPNIQPQNAQMQPQNAQMQLQSAQNAQMQMPVPISMTLLPNMQMSNFINPL